MRAGIVYTETVVHAAAERYAAEAPFQVAIVDLSTGSGPGEGGRITARIAGDRVAIGDSVIEVESPDSAPDAVPHFRKS
jgi:uncharacterized OB-fold protein